jgi:hypothetical protein
MSYPPPLPPPPPPPNRPDPSRQFIHGMSGAMGGCFGIVLAMIVLFVLAVVFVALTHH